MYCTDYLARQGLIDSNGDPVGFAGLASHLHYHEPYNLAFCHLLHRGVLHTVCKKTAQGLISEETMRDLLILLNFLFGRMKLHIPSYEARKSSFTNSKVLLPSLAPQFQESLKEFNSGIDKSFAIYLNAAAKHYKEEEKAELPLSGMSYKLGKSLGVFKFKFILRIVDSWFIISPSSYLPIKKLIIMLPWRYSGYQKIIIEPGLLLLIIVFLLNRYKLIYKVPPIKNHNGKIYYLNCQYSNYL